VIRKYEVQIIMVAHAHTNFISLVIKKKTCFPNAKLRLLHKLYLLSNEGFYGLASPMQEKFIKYLGKWL
jgi:hypothetical protein